LHYNFHRHYDPVVADYTAPDPIGLEGGYHFYAYPRNPLRWDDPFGLECVKDEEGNPLPSDHPDHPKDGTGIPALAPEPEPPPPGKPDKDIHSRYPDGTPVFEGEQPPKIKGPDPNAEGPHTVLQFDENNNRVYKAREYDANGNPVRDI